MKYLEMKQFKVERIRDELKIGKIELFLIKILFR